MGIKEKLPLINSDSKKIRIIGYVVYAWIGLAILGSLIPTPDISTSVIDENQTYSSNADSLRPLDKYNVGAMIGYSWGFDDWNISVQGNNTDGYIVLVDMGAPKDDIWSNEQFLRDTSKTFTKILEKGFKDDRINSIILTQNLNFNDKYGNKQDLPAITVGMTRSTARKIGDWDNFKQLVEIDYNNLFHAADEYTVSPVLLRN
jgi:hypothetical protein